MRKIFSLLYFLIIIFFFSPSFIFAASSSSGLDVNLHVGTCNFNNICEPDLGEDFFVCALDCTPIVVPPDSTRGTSGSLVMDNSFNYLTVEVSYTSAIIKWKSFLPTMSNIKWGTSPDYKDGVIKNINYLVDHKVEISNLTEGTTYYFTVESENLLRKTTTLENQSFRTLSSLDTTPPLNPINLKATSLPSGITLSWQNPLDEDFDYIRVMKNLDRYYGSPFIGTLVYEGKGTYFLDSKVKEGKKYFYSLFSRDRAGNYSSGSLIDVIHNPKGLDNWGEVIPPVEKVEPIPDISFIVNQGTSSYDFKNGSYLNLLGDSPITIKTNYFSNVKNDDIWVTVKNKDGSIVWEYLFSRNRDKDGYINTVIPAFEKDGYFDVFIYKYDRNQVVLINQGSFNINIIKTKDEKNTEFNSIFGYIIIAIFVLSFLWLLYFVYRKMKKHLKSTSQDSEEL